MIPKMWTFIIPLEIPSQNKTDGCINRMVKAAVTKRMRAQWAMLARSEMRRLFIPVAHGRRRVHVLAVRVRKCADIANLIGGAKPCIDGLVDAGLMTDDRDSAAIITYDQRQGKPPCTFITITEDSP